MRGTGRLARGAGSGGTRRASGESAVALATVGSLLVSMCAVQRADDAARRANEIAVLGLTQAGSSLLASADFSRFESADTGTLVTIDVRVTNDGGRAGSLTRVAVESVGGASSEPLGFKKLDRKVPPPFDVRKGFPPPTPTVEPVLAEVVEPSSRRHDFRPAVRVEAGGVADFSVQIRISASVGSIGALRSVVRANEAVASLKFFDEGGRAVAIVLWNCGLIQLGRDRKCAGTLMSRPRARDRRSARTLAPRQR